jgi:hypothetical protein
MKTIRQTNEKSLTAFQITDEMRKDIDRFALEYTEGNRSFAIRKLVTLGLQQVRADRQIAAA